MHANLNDTLDRHLLSVLSLNGLNVDPEERETDSVDAVAKGSSSGQPVDRSEEFFAETITTALLQVALRESLANGSEPFSVEAVVEESLTKLEQAFGVPEDRELLRSGIREYIEEVHKSTAEHD